MQQQKNQAVDRLVTNLSAAFGKQLSPARFDLYVEKLSKWPLSDATWARVTSMMIYELEVFPSIQQIVPYMKSAVKADGGLGDVEPVWGISKDEHGRTYARATGKFRSLVPSVHEVEQWKREACSPAEGKMVFIQAFEEAGGNVARLDEILLSLRIGKQSGDYDDSDTKFPVRAMK